MQPRAKLSLRRNKKQSQSAVPHAELSVSSSNASQPVPLPPTPSGVVAERVGSASGHVVADLVERDCVSRAHGNRGQGGGEAEDFKPPQPLARTGRAARGRKRKRQNIDSSRWECQACVLPRLSAHLSPLPPVSPLLPPLPSLPSPPTSPLSATWKLSGKRSCNWLWLSPGPCISRPHPLTPPPCLRGSEGRGAGLLELTRGTYSQLVS